MSGEIVNESILSDIDLSESSGSGAQTQRQDDHQMHSKVGDSMDIGNISDKSQIDETNLSDNVLNKLNDLSDSLEINSGAASGSGLNKSANIVDKGDSSSSLIQIDSTFDDSMDEDDNINRRRSKRIAAKEVKPTHFIDLVLDDIDMEIKPKSSSKKVKATYQPTPPPPPVQTKQKKIYTTRAKVAEAKTGTFFDHSLMAIAIIGATSIDDEQNGTSELCYLVKYENGQFELVQNKVAHKFCPELVIDFLESRILFKEKDNFDLSRELFQLSQIPETQMSQIPDHSSRSLEI